MNRSPGAEQLKKLTKIFKMWMDSCQENLGAILSRTVSVSGARLLDSPAEKVYGTAELLDESIAFPVTLTDGAECSFYMVFRKKDLSVMIDLLIGGDGTSPMDEFDDMHIIVVMQTLSQLIELLPPILETNMLPGVRIQCGEPKDELKKVVSARDIMVMQFQLKIEELADSLIEILFTADFCSSIVGTEQEILRTDVSEMPPAGNNSGGGQAPMFRKAKFGSLSPDDTGGESKNLNMILDIPLQLSVVLGSTGVNLRDLIDLKPGSIFSLDKLAGEPAELYVNDRFVGYGEVIVVDENFGVRVIDVPDSDASRSAAGGATRRKK